MGLLEKALKYKKDINDMGKETLIDRIAGPAETEVLAYEDSPRDEDSREVVLTDNPGSGEDTPPQNLEEEGNHHPESIDGDGGEGVSSVEGEQNAEEDVIVTLSEEDLVEAFEEESGQHATSDDLFQLPDVDEESPLETLKEQQESVQEAVDEEIAAGRPAPREYVPIEEEPFGPEDEPQLPSREEVSGEAGHAAGIASSSKMVKEPIPRRVRESATGREEARSAGTVVKRPDKKFQDFLMLYEIGKEIVAAGSREELYDVILFSIMGQIGAASSSIMVPSEDPRRWSIVDSRGVTVRDPLLYFSTEDSIFQSVISGRELIDIEQYKDLPEHRDEYYKFISIDARLLSPMSYEGEMVGTVVLGDKITIGDYSEEEKDFIQSVCEIAAIALRKINEIEKLTDENRRYHAEIEYAKEIEAFVHRLVEGANIRGLSETIREYFEQLGISSYALFLRSEDGSEFIPLVVEEQDYLALKESGFSVQDDHPFIGYAVEHAQTTMIDFEKVVEIHELFDDRILKKISIFWLYPFTVGMTLIGFLIIFRIDDTGREEEIESKLRRLSEGMFTSILTVRRYDTEELRHINTVDVVLRRAEEALENAKNLRMPLTLMFFSIKNFKRYYSLYGYHEATKLIQFIEETIIGRLSTHDFSARVDRNKILIVLPGKNKKYAVPLANAIRNEVLQGFKKKEMQLLITFLTAEYPEDGEDLYALLDAID